MTSVESSIIIIVGSVQVTSRPIYIQNITHETLLYLTKWLHLYIV